MKLKYLLVLGFICTLGSPIYLGAVSIFTPVSYTGGLMYSAFDYVWDALKYGIDSTRTLNITVARVRDFVQTKKGTNKFLQRADELNGPNAEMSEEYQNLFKKHRNIKAHVRLDSGIGVEEQNFVRKRMDFIEQRILQKNQNKGKHFLKNPIFEKAARQKKFPTVGLCMSGGGFRAMLSAAGMLKALEDSELIDLIMYASVLSGSTWVTVPRALGKPLDALIDGYKKYANLPLNPKAWPAVFKKHPQMYPSEEEQRVLKDNILRKFYNNQPFDAIDIYGPLIAHMVLSPFDDSEILKKYNLNHTNSIIESRQRVLFSQAAITLAENNYGTFPLPIATAISPVKGYFTSGGQKLGPSKMAWFEFTPYEMGTEYYAKDGSKIGGFIPMCSMGAIFEKKLVNGNEWLVWLGLKNGTIDKIHQVDNPSEYSLSNLLGIWGSAFTFSLRDLFHVLGYENFLFDSMSASSYKKMIMKAINIFMAPLQVSLFKSALNARIWPATINNFMQHAPNSPFTDKTITLVDAGIDINTPFPPLLRQARKVDVILVLDSSAPVFKKDGNGGYKITALEHAEKWAQRNNIPFPQIVGSEAYKRATMLDANGRVKHHIITFKGENGASTVIFVPLADNKYTDDTDFKIAKCLKEDCSTLNFNYTAQNIENLVKAVYDTLNGSIDQIEEVLIEVTKNKLGAAVAG